MLISQVFRFDSAHKLPNYNGKCKELHGHTWKLIVTLEGEVKENGMILDFHDIKKNINEKVINKLDHKYLNDIIENPTTENILIWTRDQLKDLKELKRLKLFETENSFAELVL